MHSHYDEEAPTERSPRQRPSRSTRTGALVWICLQCGAQQDDTDAGVDTCAVCGGQTFWGTVESQR